MGCSESKIHNVTTVIRCKERKAFIKQSVSAHAAFVSAHLAYAEALKNTGAALFDYAQSGLQSLDDHSGRPPLQSPPENNEILAWDFFIALMEDVRGPSPAVIDDKHGGIEKPAIRRNVNLVKVFRELDDGFIKASESACEASKIHEANKLHYHSSFADNQGQIKQSIRVMRVLNGAKVDFSSKKKETLATLLHKMVAWEKRLHDQMKAGEKMKHEYQKKMASLNKHRKRGISSNRLKQTEATVNHLHARYIVETQSVGSTVSEINRLRDEHLYPKLVQIVAEMKEMWRNIQKQHEQQLTSVQRLVNIRNSQLPKNTSDHNMRNIERIHVQVTIWCSELGNLILHQNEFIKSLNNWLKLNLISIDDNVKPQNPKIEPLLRTWNDQIEKLPETRAKTAISCFRSVIVEIVEYYSDEMEIKHRCDDIRSEIIRKSRGFEEWCDKQIAKRVPSNEMDDMEVIAEQQADVEVLRRRLAAEEEEVYRRRRVQVKDKSLVKLTDALTEVLTAMTEFSSACSNMYGSLESH